MSKDKKPLTLHGIEIKGGERVWAVPWGWGIIETSEIDTSLLNFVCVKFDGFFELFDENGFLSANDGVNPGILPCLFWNEIDMTPTPPEKRYGFVIVFDTGRKLVLHDRTLKRMQAAFPTAFLYQVEQNGHYLSQEEIDRCTFTGFKNANT